MENPIKMDDLGVPLFLETPICFPMDFQMISTNQDRVEKSFSNDMKHTNEFHWWTFHVSLSRKQSQKRNPSFNPSLLWTILVLGGITNRKFLTVKLVSPACPASGRPSNQSSRPSRQSLSCVIQGSPPKGWYQTI